MHRRRKALAQKLIRYRASRAEEGEFDEFDKVVYYLRSWPSKSCVVAFFKRGYENINVNLIFELSTAIGAVQVVTNRLSVLEKDMEDFIKELFSRRKIHYQEPERSQSASIWKIPTTDPDRMWHSLVEQWDLFQFKAYDQERKLPTSRDSGQNATQITKSQIGGENNALYYEALKAFIERSEWTRFLGYEFGYWMSSDKMCVLALYKPSKNSFVSLMFELTLNTDNVELETFDEEAAQTFIQELETYLKCQPHSQPASHSMPRKCQPLSFNAEKVVSNGRMTKWIIRCDGREDEFWYSLLAICRGDLGKIEHVPVRMPGATSVW